MKTLYDVIARPVVTEKGSILRENNQFVIEVAKDATKNEIKDAVEKLFKVKVAAVNTTVMPGKWRRVGKSTAKTSSWKKAVVTLKDGEKFDFIES